MIKVSIYEDRSNRTLMFEIRLVENSDPKQYNVLNDLNDEERNLLDRSLKERAKPFLIFEAVNLLMDKTEKHFKLLDERGKKLNANHFIDPTNRSYVWKITISLNELIELDLDLHDRELLERAMRPKELPSVILEALMMLVKKTEVPDEQPTGLERLNYLH